MHEKITLPNGVRIVYEHVPGVRSASCGIWVQNGSRNEPAKLSGISHFIEHMVFKGTEKRSAADIASEMDGIGGQINAFTTKECTSFYIKALDNHLGKALDVLCDMFFLPRFYEADVNNERGVIVEEIGMYEDSPEDLVSERLSEAVYAKTPLGRPILGTRKTLAKIAGADMKMYMKENYKAGSVVVAISGSFSDADIEFIKNAFGAMPAAGKNKVEQAAYKPAAVAKKKTIEQNHICIGFEAGPYKSEDRFTLALINNIMGGGMSSRLFQGVREKLGLCYSVYSFLSLFADTGAYYVYTATNRETEEKALHAIRNELATFAEKGPTPEELDRAREQIKANLLMGLESTGSRMNQLAKGELFYDKLIDAEEIIKQYDAITAEQIRTTTEKIFNFSRLSVSAVGRTKDADYYANTLRG